MSSSYSANPNNFLPETFIIPDDPEEFKVKLTQYLNDIASSINTKSYGLYDPEETITGNKFIPTFNGGESANAEYRDVFRVVVDTGALPNAATKLVPHGITTTQNFSLIHLYGGATDPGATTINFALGLPYTFVPAGNDVRVYMDATNIYIVTSTASFINYTRSFVVVEYIKLV